MMKAIVIAFTLKEQPKDKILKRIADVAALYPDAVLIHGFLPRKVVLEKGFDTDVIDALDKHFPVQFNLWNDKPLRNEMAQFAFDMGAQIIVIGDIKEGVAEEVAFYSQYAMEIRTIPLDGDIPPCEGTKVSHVTGTDFINDKGQSCSVSMGKITNREGGYIVVFERNRIPTVQFAFSNEAARALFFVLSRVLIP